jgi:transcriptional regulator GlxA family with amidase domain
MPSEFNVVFPLFPRVAQLDFTGPLEVFGRLPGARVVLATTEGGSLTADPGLELAHLAKLADVNECAVLCVPGGFGVTEALGDVAFLAQLRRLAESAHFVTSVCSGSLLLGAAGLLRGKRAACHWAWLDLLPTFGAIPDPDRVVVDGRVVTGGGVTAGIDLALRVVADLQGEAFARALTLAIEYAPSPPFEAGRPELVEPELLEQVRNRLHTERPRRLAALGRLQLGSAPDLATPLEEAR